MACRHAIPLDLSQQRGYTYHNTYENGVCQMEMYVIRHGQSQANAANQLAGWLNIPLTEKGIGDAQGAGRKIAGIEFEKVFASDLIRAVQTCENALPGVEYEKCEMIRELSVGEFEGLYYDESSTEPIYDRFRECRKDRDYSPCGGESHQMQLDRVAAFMDMVSEKYTGTVAAFTHAGTLECMLHYVFGFKIPATALAIPNCCICVLEWTGKRWRLKHWNI